MLFSWIDGRDVKILAPDFDVGYFFVFGISRTWGRTTEVDESASCNTQQTDSQQVPAQQFTNFTLRRQIYLHNTLQRNIASRTLSCKQQRWHLKLLRNMQDFIWLDFLKLRKWSSRCKSSMVSSSGQHIYMRYQELIIWPRLISSESVEDQSWPAVPARSRMEWEEWGGLNAFYHVYVIKCSSVYNHTISWQNQCEVMCHLWS